MMETGEKVLYAGNGLCEVTEITKINFGSGAEEYYVLKPIFAGNNTFFIPAGNEKMLSKIRKVISKDDVDNIISKAESCKAEWINDEHLRKEEYRKILNSGDCLSVLKMINALHAHREELKCSGKKLHQSDEHILRDAENVLYDEFAYVLGISKDDAAQYITDHFNIQ